MLYFKPEGDFFAGDCMPFFHNGTFHLYYLLDENHHKALGGLGGHQWAHASTTDLIHWQHYPLALAITDDFEKSICTGSVYFHEGIYYAFYATRLSNWYQQLGWATSKDAIHFDKQQPNPLAVPPSGYSPLHFRDPCPFQDPQTGLFHLLVTAMLEDPAVHGHGGCLAHLTSSDLKTWTMQAPFLIPGYNNVPECPDLFYWNGWYYLIFSTFLTAHYRMSRNPLGPWLCPPVDTLDGALSRVMKTAAFGENRRIGVSWLGTRSDDQDDGKPQWGGHLLFREIIQHEDGTLGSKFVQEMLPETDEARTIGRVHLPAWSGLEVSAIENVPHNVHIRLHVVPNPNSATFGLRLHSTEDFSSGYALTFHVPERMVTLHHEPIYAVEGLDRPFTLDLILKDDIIDVCIDQRCCLVNRCPEQRGDRLFFFAHNADVIFENVDIRPLK
ncbi:MAG: family 43 glycosylhydrolase [Caldilineaceae bacterium]